MTASNDPNGLRGRLVVASGGDEDHAARIERVVEDLRAHSVAPRSADVIVLPSRPYDHDLEDELVDEQRVAPLASWTVAVVLGAGAWAILAGVAWSLYVIVEALR